MNRILKYLRMIGRGYGEGAVAEDEMVAEDAVTKCRSEHPETCPYHSPGAVANRMARDVEKKREKPKAKFHFKIGGVNSKIEERWFTAVSIQKAIDEAREYGCNGDRRFKKRVWVMPLHAYGRDVSRFGIIDGDEPTSTKRIVELNARARADAERDRTLRPDAGAGSGSGVSQTGASKSDNGAVRGVSSGVSGMSDDGRGRDTGRIGFSQAAGEADNGRGLSERHGSGGWNRGVPVPPEPVAKKPQGKPEQMTFSLDAALKRKAAAWRYLAMCQDGFGAEAEGQDRGEGKKDNKRTTTRCVVQDETIEEHDKKYHPEGYKEGDECNKRAEMAKGDKTDAAVGEKEGAGKRGSVTPEEDAAYADAVKRGDKDAALRMIREAAAKAMPNTKVVGEDGLPLVVWHGGTFGKPKIVLKDGKYVLENNYIAQGEIHFGTKDAALDRLLGKYREDREGWSFSKNGWERRSLYSPERPLIAKYEHKFDSVDQSKEHALTEGQGKTLVPVFLDLKNIDYTEDQIVWEEKIAESMSSGFDGIAYQNDFEDHGKFSYIPFSPSQIKSADITYDDAGNLIPLSKRFNMESVDIRDEAKGKIEKYLAMCEVGRKDGDNKRTTTSEALTGKVEKDNKRTTTRGEWTGEVEKDNKRTTTSVERTGEGDNKRTTTRVAQDAKPIGVNKDGTFCYTEGCEKQAYKFSDDASDVIGGGGAESAEERAKREYDEVVKRYKGTAAWMKAPNGKATNLTERQWVQVRTPSFKKWFGDWEKVATADAILKDDDIVVKDSILQLDAVDQRQVADVIYDRLKGGPAVETVDGRNVKFYSRGFKEIKHHSADPHTLALVPILKETISSAHYIGDGEKENKPKDKDVNAYHIYARRVNLGDGSMIARIVIREDKNGNQFYDEESTSLKYIKEILDQGSREPNTGSDQKSPYAKNSLADYFCRVNGVSASKVVDENGEPKVMSHYGTFDGIGGTPVIGSQGMHFGTHQAAVDRKRQKVGDMYRDEREPFVFQDSNGMWQYETGDYNSEESGCEGYESKEEAERAANDSNYYDAEYSDDEETGMNETQVFLNIRNPAHSKDMDERWDEVIGDFKKKGYDGIEYVNEHEDYGSVSYVAFSPNQVKSATENSGEFSIKSNKVTDSAAWRYLAMCQDDFGAEAEGQDRGEEERDNKRAAASWTTSGREQEAQDEWVDSGDGNIAWKSRKKGAKRTPMERLSKRMVHEIISENVKLIKSVKQDMLPWVAKNIYRVLNGKMTPDDLVDWLMDECDLSEGRAYVLACDQVRKAKEKMKVADWMNKGIKYAVWKHREGAKDPREYHRAKWDGKSGVRNGKPNGLDGFVFRLDRPPVIDLKTKERGLPSTLVGCRCYLQGIKA